ncbi:MAG: SWIM zinc finger family protein [Candidatus Eiseniibacteriota bacterium]|jgi:uncharacterized Zn finger protein
MAPRRGTASTWWGKRWTAALEALGAAWRNRLPRGRTYAREGRVAGLTVERGRVTAYVVGSLPRPYEIVIGLRPLSDRQWRKVTERLADRAGYAARLLAGEMPDDIEEAFAACGVALFPERPEDLKLSCSCPDLAAPCKHVAAAHYALGEAFDYDPFLLFALRGRDRDALLAGLRAARAPGRGRAAGAAAAADATPEDASADGTDTEATPEIDPVTFGQWRADVTDLGFRIEPPAVRMAVLRSLGKPPGWRERTTLATALDPTYATASALALRIALGGDEEAATAEGADDGEDGIEVGGAGAARGGSRDDHDDPSGGTPRRRRVRR